MKATPLGLASLFLFATPALAMAADKIVHLPFEQVVAEAQKAGRLALQNDAKAAGANAVVDIVSNYNDVVYSDPANYECHVGFLMSGVQLKAKLAKVQ